MRAQNSCPEALFAGVFDWIKAITIGVGAAIDYDDTSVGLEIGVAFKVRTAQPLKRCASWAKPMDACA